MQTSKIKKPTLAIIIPAYNEEHYLGACLDAIARQTVPPDEVIVVNNNSNDETVTIARSYPFVRVVHEKRQGRAYAKAAGFAAAKSDILGRIDADTHLSPTWSEDVKKYFTEHARVAAVTGRGIAYDFPFGRFVGWVQVVFYQFLQYFAAGGYVLWGSNMALRYEAWKKVATQLHTDTHLDEDIDLSVVLLQNGYRIGFTPRLVVYASVRRGETGPLAAIRYFSSWPRDYFANKKYIAGVYICMLTALSLVVVLPVSLLTSFARLFTKSKF